MTEPTKELINLSYPNLFNLNIKTINYHQKVKLYNGRSLELLPADHVLGSSQILFRNEYSILYSSDFLLTPKTEIPKEIDLLIVDATYGEPTQTRPSLEKIFDFLNNLIRSANRPIYFFTHQGKIQKTMHLLRTYCGNKKPIILSNKSYKIAKIYTKNGLNLGEFHQNNTDNGKEIIKNRNYIAFIDTSKKQKCDFFIKDSFKISLSGWIFNKPFIKIGKNHYSISFSAHADFNDLIEYIKNCKPKFVITDNFRFGSAEKLSSYIKKKLNINSIHLPIKNN
ncbi:MAG: hypothetical protein GF329_16935 [Candidatus Lokiarchaeota archaeon]|nr:hypothetical protein [Candidatus Lokiarchaeota archaeon]